MEQLALILLSALTVGGIGAFGFIGRWMFNASSELRSVSVILDRVVEDVAALPCRRHGCCSNFAADGDKVEVP